MGEGGERDSNTMGCKEQSENSFRFEIYTHKALKSESCSKVERLYLHSVGLFDLQDYKSSRQREFKESEIVTP